MHLPLRLVKAAARRGQRRGSQALAAPVAGMFQWETTIFGTQLLVLKDKNNSSPNIILSGKSLKRCFSLGVKKEIEGRREEGKCIRKIIRAVRPGWGGAGGGFRLRKCGQHAGAAASSPPGQRRGQRESAQNRARSSHLESLLYLSAVIQTCSGNNLPCVEMSEK